MSEWQEVSLGEITEPVKNTYLPTSNEQLAYVGLEHIEQETLRLTGVGKSSDVTSNKFKFEVNDVLFGKLRPYFRKVYKPKFSGICSTDIWVFRAKKGFVQDFLFYFLASWDFVDTANSGEGGTRMPRADWNFLKTTSWLVPCEEEQKAIASVLSSLDDKIDLLHRQNTTLERMAETLFRQWFVEETQSFATGKIGSLIEGTFGGDWGKEAPEGDFTNAVNCIRGTDIADLQTGLAKKIPLRFVSTMKLQSIEPKNGDIIFEISGGTETQSTGRATYINIDVRSLFAYPLVFSNFCRLLRPLNTTYSYFIYLYLSYLYEQDEFFGLENGSSGIKNLNYKALFFELDYPMPPLNRVQEFNNLVTPNFSKINQNKKQIQTLEKLRDNLLPKLMSGEVRVVLQAESALYA